MIYSKPDPNDGLPDNPLQQIANRVAVLQRFEPQLREALERTFAVENFHTVCARVMTGDLILHDLGDAVMLCEVASFAAGDAHGSTYHVHTAAGNLDTILGFQRYGLIAAARMAGCVKLSCNGRIGWQRVLQKEGWKPTSITLIREIPNE